MTTPAFLEPISPRVGRLRPRARAMRDHLDWPESEAIHILREVAGQCRNPPCSSPAARIRWCCCGSPKRRSALARFPFPLLHIDTGHNFPEVIAFRDQRAAGAGRAADRALGRGLDRQRAASCSQTPRRKPQRRINR